MRSFVRETRLSPEGFVYPLFVCPGEGVRKEVRSMPGVFNLSVDEAVKECAEVKSLGIPSVILFGLPETKDEVATGAWADDGIVQKAARAIKREVPGLLLMGDVCLCEYMSHGHCGMVDTTRMPRRAEACIRRELESQGKRSSPVRSRPRQRRPRSRRIGRGLRNPQRSPRWSCWPGPRSRRPRRAWTSSRPPT